MCGIVGVISTREIGQPVLTRMTDALAHRGPDGHGYLQASAGGRPPVGIDAAHPALPINVSFGHRRLSIVDLSSAGTQPLFYAGRYAIVFNGEIYNYKEIRAQLENLGHRFVTHTDTEVILAAYHEWGLQCVQQFNGMWAFAMLDFQVQTLFLARDRIGVKPLYYFQTARTLAFASEIKALLHCDEYALQVEREACHDFIRYGVDETARATLFKGIERFPAAHCLLLDLKAMPRGPLQPQRYWSVQPNLSQEPFDAQRAAGLCEQYRELLTDAVRLRLRADVKVGSALSGGLDSSTIVLLVNELLGKTVAQEQQITFSSVYESGFGAAIDESAYIGALARHLGLNSKTIEPVASTVAANYERMIYAMDEPPDGTCMGGWYTFQLVRRWGIKVTLDGQGADEQLAGYLQYFVPYFTHSRNILPAARATWRNPQLRTMVVIGATLGMMRRVGMSTPMEWLARATGRRKSPYQLLNDRLLADTTGPLLQNLLRYADRTSMAHGVESRMPFVDYRLVEFLAQLPAAYKIHDGWSKYLARLAIAGRLPEEVVWRRSKLGWPAPDREWLSGPLRGWASKELRGSELLGELGKSSSIDALLARRGPLNPLIRRLNLAVWERVVLKNQLSQSEQGDSAGMPVLPGALCRQAS